MATKFLYKIGLAHADAIGSTNMVTDQTGTPVWDVDYYPWGQVWQQTGTRGRKPLTTISYCASLICRVRRRPPGWPWQRGLYDRHATPVIAEGCSPPPNRMPGPDKVRPGYRTMKRENY